MLRIIHYIEFLDSAGQPMAPADRYQPYFINETRTIDGLTFKFAPFSIAGDLSTDGNETGEQELIAPANTITTAKLFEASQERYLVKVYSVLLSATPPSGPNSFPAWSELLILSSTIYACDSFGYADKAPADDGDENFSPVTLRLANSLNFVTGTAPTRRLTAAQVGPLPASGGITF